MVSYSFAFTISHRHLWNVSYVRAKAWRAKWNTGNHAFTSVDAKKDSHTSQIEMLAPFGDAG